MEPTWFQLSPGHCGQRTCAQRLGGGGWAISGLVLAVNSPPTGVAHDEQGCRSRLRPPTVPFVMATAPSQSRGPETKHYISPYISMLLPGLFL